MTIPDTTESQLAVISAVIVEPAAFAECVQVVGPSMFTLPELTAAWEWMTTLFSEGRPISLYLLSQRFGSDPLYQKFRETITAAPGVVAGNASYAAAILADRSRLRKTVSALLGVLEGAGKAHSFAQVRPGIEELLVSVFGESGRHDLEHVSKSVERVLDSMRNPSAAARRFTTGFRELDKMLSGGIGEKHLVIVAGKAGEGKTTVAMNILTNMAEAGVPCGVFSLEMDGYELALRAGLSVSRRCADVEDAMGKIAGLPIWVSDNPDRTAESIRAAMRLMALKHGIKAVVVDYIQLIGVGPTRDSRERQVANMSRSLKLAAKENGMAVIALSQLNDDGQLRESRAIEQDADGVIYIVAKDEEHYLWIQKNRHGPKHGTISQMAEDVERTGIRLRFDKPNFRFTEK